MTSWFEGMSALEAFFAFCALGGGALFIVRLLLQFVGGVADGADDALDITDNDPHLGDSDVSFKILSLQGLTSFFLMFGLVGLAMKQGHYVDALALIAALASGFVSVWAIQKVFVMMLGLQSSGTMNPENAVGAEGTVYLTIAPNDRGKVQVVVQGHQKVLEALTEGDEALPTGARVKVVRVFNGNVLVVEKLATPAETVS